MKNAKIKRQITDMLNGRESLKRATVSRMNKAQQGADEARREMERATKADDEAAFIAAADKERFNAAIITECKERLEAMEAVPKEEAGAMVREIQAAQAEIESAATRKAADSIAAFYSIAADAEREIDELQEILNKYCNATGNADLAGPFMKRDKELFGLLYTIKANKSRIEQNNATANLTGIPNNGALYAGIK